ncbi:MAG: TIGR02281 family clan AA aspartic protease [Henriciella sp.]|nr:TIGR02281 family clan AA aspartic protease [Henriciella sp.]
MKFGQLIGLVVVSGAIAVAVSTLLSPKFDEDAPNAASARIEANSVDPVQNTSASVGRRSATLTQKGDGHYWARALVNNKSSVEFLVDTGASVVALTYKDAQRMGLRPDTLDYVWRVQTAGGETLGASVVIKSIKINQIHIRDVEAMVLRTDMQKSLLGMSFLNELYSYEFRGDRLILKQ